jgi:hypothetical protein
MAGTVPVSNRYRILPFITWYTIHFDSTWSVPLNSRPFFWNKQNRDFSFLMYCISLYIGSFGVWGKTIRNSSLLSFQSHVLSFCCAWFRFSFEAKQLKEILCFRYKQCSGSMTFWCGSGCGSGSVDPSLWLMDPDPDPAIFVIDLQDVNKKLNLKKCSDYYFLTVHLHHFSKIIYPKEVTKQ